MTVNHNAYSVNCSAYSFDNSSIFFYLGGGDPISFDLRSNCYLNVIDIRIIHYLLLIAFTCRVI